MITDKPKKTLFNLAEMWAPEEACGMIVKDDKRDEYHKVLCLHNTSTSPNETFEMSAQNAISARNRYHNNYVVWHSHPKSRPIPSEDDIELIELIRVPMVIVSLYPVKQIHCYGFQEKRIVLMWKCEGDF